MNHIISECQNTENHSPVMESVISLLKEQQEALSQLEKQNEKLIVTLAKDGQVKDEYKSLYEYAPIGHIRVNASGIITKSNTTFLSMLNLEKELVCGRPLSLFLKQEDVQLFSFLFPKILSSTGQQELEVKFERQDKTTFHALIKLHPTEHCHIDGEYQAIIIDISKRKMAEEIIKAQEQRFRSLSQNTPNSVILFDIDGTCQYMNPSAQQLFNVRRYEAEGSNIYLNIPTTIAVAFTKNLQTIIQDKRKTFFDEALSIQGKVHFFRIHLLPVCDNTGNVTHVMVLLLDITPKNDQEDEIKQKMEDAIARSRQFPLETLRQGIQLAVTPKLEDLQTQLDFLQSAFPAQLAHAHESIRRPLDLALQNTSQLLRIMHNIEQIGKSLD